MDNILYDLIDEINLSAVQTGLIKIFGERFLRRFHIKANDFSDELTQRLRADLCLIVLFRTYFAPKDLLQRRNIRLVQWNISNDAKVLYALLLDRASISRQNGYIDPDGTIRLYFTVEQVQKKLHRSRQCAARIFRELEYSGLIIRKKQGLGKPAVITLNYPADARLIMKEDDADVG